MNLLEDVVDRPMNQAVQVGNVYKIAMTSEEGITPKYGYTTRDKYFVVLGFDDRGNVYGGVVVNSKINPNLPSTVTDYYMPLSKKDYPFLQYDSFVNCSQLKMAHVNKLAAATMVGGISTEDLDIIKGTVVESPNETRIRLKQFGLL